MGRTRHCVRGVQLCIFVFASIFAPQGHTDAAAGRASTLATCPITKGSSGSSSTGVTCFVSPQGRLERSKQNRPVPLVCIKRGPATPTQKGWKPPARCQRTRLLMSTGALLPSSSMPTHTCTHTIPYPPTHTNKQTRDAYPPTHSSSMPTTQLGRVLD